MRSPAASSYNALRTMQANRRESGIERLLRRSLWAAGTRGYRVNAPMPGRPDIAFPRARLAVFVNGCYWHRCPTCALPMPKANADFWREKLRRNATRDRDAIASLTKVGWGVITVWEHEIKADVDDAARHIAEMVSRRVRAREMPDGRLGPRIRPVSDIAVTR